MLSAREVLHRVFIGYYSESDTWVFNRDLCRVLDLSIACVGDQDASASTGYDSCSSLWLLDMCWPSAPVNSVAQQQCPESESTQGIFYRVRDNISMQCNASTREWAKIQDQSCFVNMMELAGLDDTVNDSLHLNQSMRFDEIGAELNEDVHSDMMDENWYSTLGTLVTVGHALSFTFLIIALILLFFLKHLHCTRIFIHMNLMVAFIIRGIVWSLHHVAFQTSRSFQQKSFEDTILLGGVVFGRYNSSALPQLLKWKEDLCDPFDQSHNFVSCRVYYVIQNYSVTANYYWLLAEGLYLGLLLRAMNPNKHHKAFMKAFLVLGWGLPWLSVTGSAITKLHDPTESESCWFDSKNKMSYWIIKIPIILSLLLNFGIFILVVTVVGSKLKVNNQRHQADNGREHYKWRLTKSTLALIPLLGIQYLITVFLDVVDTEYSVAIFVKQVFETMFTSIQGLLVALIYCFFNGEIQAECKRSWSAWKTNWDLKLGNRKRKKYAPSQTSLTNLYSSTIARKFSAVSTTAVRKQTSASFPLHREGCCRKTSNRTSTLSRLTPSRSDSALHVTEDSDTKPYTGNELAVQQCNSEHTLSVPTSITHFSGRNELSGAAKSKGVCVYDCSCGENEQLLNVPSSELVSSSHQNLMHSEYFVPNGTLKDTVV